MPFRCILLPPYNSRGYDGGRLITFMAHAVPENEGSGEGKERRRQGFGGTILLQQGAHVTVLDARGCIITVNDAWETFGRENGLDPAYRFIGASYVGVCERAVKAAHGNEGARDAL